MKTTLYTMMALLLGAVAGCGTTTADTNKCATVTCGAGQICDGATGACTMSSKCATAACSGSQVCDGATGMCVAKDQCAGVSCTGGMVCNTTAGMCVNPGVPALGIQIDRMGRPAVNTALTNPFDLYKPIPGAANPTEPGDVTKARYNADANSATWATAQGFIPAVNMHLAILDGLDGGNCGNQFGFNKLGVLNYGLLASVLAGDALQVDTTKGTCNGYLAVEVGVVNAMANTECGGRTLSMDVIDTTYSALAAGVLMGVTDGIAQSTAPMATFPFLTAAP